MRKLLVLVSFLVLTSCAQMGPIHSNPVKLGSKVGKACATYALYNFHLGGENYIHSAAKEGRISKVSSVNRKTSGLFPFYYKDCTIVSGR